MNSGAYRHRITLESPVNTQDATTGENVVTWATAESDTGDALCNIPAKVMTGKGREFHQSSVIQSETTARINFRWFAGLDTSWRILWDGRVYNIESAELDLTARKEWRLMCTDGVNDG